MGEIGTASEYDVLIANTLWENSEVTWRSSSVNWGSITWQRARNTTSIAEVTIPGVAIGLGDCGVLSNLKAWDRAIWILRDGVRVWDGLVTGWKTTGGDLTITARDRSSMFAKRLVGVDRDFTDTDLYEVVAGLLVNCGLVTYVEDPVSPSNPFYLTVTPNYLDDPSSLVITREYRVARLDKIDKVIAELVDTAGLEWSILNSEMRLSAKGLWSGNDSFGYAVLDPVLNERTIVGGVLDVTVDGSAVATQMYVGSDSAGPSGFANRTNVNNGTYSDIALQEGIPESQINPGDSPARAAFVNGAKLATPDVTLEKVQLSPRFGSRSFPSDLTWLVPGVIYPIDFPDSCALNIPIVTMNLFDYEMTAESATVDHVRLDQLDVKVERHDDGSLSETFLGSFTAVAI